MYPLATCLRVGAATARVPRARLGKLQRWRRDRQQVDPPGVGAWTLPGRSRVDTDHDSWLLKPHFVTPERSKWLLSSSLA